MPTNRGPRGRIGKHGVQGERGAVGQRGRRGEPGPAGPAGPTGAKASREEIFAAVEEQLGDIRSQLAIQLTRFGQLQAQLDHIEKLLKQLVSAP